MVRIIGRNNLLFARVPLILIAYGCYLMAVAGRTGSVTKAKAADTGEADFSFGDIARDIARSRHIQALMLLIAMQILVDPLIAYQFKYMTNAPLPRHPLTPS